MAFVFGVAVFVLVLMGSIALHEVGHMVPAKRFGVRVSRYVVGFGPTLWSRTRGETEYAIKAFPIGGFVRLTGMIPPPEAVGNPRGRGRFAEIAAAARAESARDLRPGEEHRAFYLLSTPKKLVVMLGGPVMNLLIAVVLLGVVLTGFGVPQETTTLARVSACVLPVGAEPRECTPADTPAPAAAAGLRPGDRVLSYAGTPITDWRTLQETIRASGGRTVPIVVERDGQEVRTQITPILAERPVLDADGRVVRDADGTVRTTKVGFLGISPTTERRRQPVTQVPVVVGEQLTMVGRAIVTLPQRMVDVAEAAFGTAPRSVEGVVGIVGVGRLVGEISSVQAEGFDLADRTAGVLSVLASLNLALFAFNLIPLLPLDGGHIAGALWEGARRQVARWRGLPQPGPADTARLMPYAVGVFILLAGMGLLLAYADIVRPVTLTG